MITLLIVLAVVRGALYGAVQWPWYAPDETDHVEYALLTQAHGPFVTRAQMNSTLRMEIASELHEWRIYQSLPAPDEDPMTLWTGQTGRQPFLYYTMAGIIARLAPFDDLTTQLQYMRLLSALIGGLSVAVIYLTGRLIDRSSPLFALGIAGVALFQTTTGALAGAVTNDSLAILAVSLVLLACLTLVRGPHTRRRFARHLIVLAGAVVLAFLAKRTAIVAIIPATLALLIVTMPCAYRWLACRRLLPLGTLAAMASLAILAYASVHLDDTQTRSWAMANGVRVIEQSPLGSSYSLLLGANGGPAAAGQSLSGQQIESLRGQRATFGIWLRRAEPGTPVKMTLQIQQTTNGDIKPKRRSFEVGNEWIFHSVATAIPDQVDRVSVAVEMGQPVTGGVLAGGAALVAQDYTDVPEPLKPGSPLTWGSAPVDNLLANPYYVDAGLRPRPWLRDAAQMVIGRDPDTLFLPMSNDIRPPTTQEEWQVWIWEPFFESLWGRLGRLAEINMPVWWYTTHAGLLIAASAGAMLSTVRLAWQRRVTWFGVVAALLFAATLATAAALIITPYGLGIYPGWPFGRYVLVALLPLASLYIYGFAWFWPARLRTVAVATLLATLASLDAYVLFYVLPTHFSIGAPGIS